MKTSSSIMHRRAEVATDHVTGARSARMRHRGHAGPRRAARSGNAVDPLDKYNAVQGDLLLDSTLPQLGHPLAGLTVVEQTPSRLLLSPERPGRPLLLGLDLRHLQRLRYLVHRARLADFDGELRVDARGAVLAELRLFNGSGVQHGSVQVSYGAAGPPPALYRFSLVAERRLRLRLPVTLAADQTAAEMCLRPEGSAEAALCRQLPISRQPLETLHRDTGPDSQLTVDGQTNPINNMERFLRALNPATWLQSGGSWTTAFGVVVDLVMVIVAITIVCKCISCCRAACCCRRQSSQKV
ncbi:uncharacterized protein LOC122392143 [Amphibalanus amphitrite]|uniref:uncharacterized protein LOC122392143 n=1 Tax=Amphibalanus amphitrite TaxID=1232801 RepID=UPI001C9086CA|nr:uncharacterized protein LOC122392143 [Amphibalanus amphitrite]